MPALTPASLRSIARVVAAAASVLGPSVLTGGVTIDYLRPAREGTLIAHAVVQRPGRRQVVCRCDILVRAAPGEEPVLCSVAQGTTLTVTPRSDV